MVPFLFVIFWHFCLMVPFFVAKFSHIPQFIPYLLLNFRTFLKWYHFCFIFFALCLNRCTFFKATFYIGTFWRQKGKRGLNFWGFNPFKPLGGYKKSAIVGLILKGFKSVAPPPPPKKYIIGCYNNVVESKDFVDTK